MTKKLKTLKAKDIKPYSNNPRINDNAVEAVMESIKQCEYIAPIIVDEDNIILAGHTRYKALQTLGKAEIEVMQVTGLTDEQKRKYRILDNKTNELAFWDFDALELELAGLDFNGFDFGFDIEQVETIDEGDLDADDEKSKVNVTIVFDNYFDFQDAEERLQNIADEIGASMSYKMV